MSARASAGRSVNLWSWYFWFVEITFAIIGGTTEMWVYRQFMPGGPISDAEAFARAWVTQLAIVGFSAAGVKAIQTITGSSKYLVFFAAQAFALFFALVTFDLMLVAALAFRNTEQLGTQDPWVLPTPWGDVHGLMATLFIVAGVPFFQWAIGIFGPIITKERKQLSAEEILAQGEASLAQAEVNARLLKAKTLGYANAARAAFGRKAPQVVDALPARSEDDNPGGSENETRGVLMLLPGGKGKAPSARGPWNKADLCAYVAQAYPGVSISDTEALSVIKTIGKGRMKGTAYVASITQVKAWASRTYSASNPQDSEAENVG